MELVNDRTNDAPEQMRRLHILLAEDNEINQKIATMLFTLEGHTIAVVENGQQVLAWLEHQTCDVLLLDVEMPVMDGFEAAAAIRAREAGTGRHLPIIALTAHALKAKQEQCLAAGMDGYVSKPIQRAQLRKVLAECLSTATEHVVAPAEDAEGDPVYDRAAALARIDGDSAFLQQLIDLFHRDAPRYLGEIRSALAAGNTNKTQRSAHTLKGALANFAAPAAYEAAQQLEAAAGAGDLASAEALCVPLEKEIDRSRAAFAREAAPAALAAG